MPPPRPGISTSPSNPGRKIFWPARWAKFDRTTSIDIKTEGRIGVPVVAAADGFVARVKASAYGYGNVVYLQHANGLMTVYGHLERFAPKLADVMKREQYKREQFECEMMWDKPGISFKQGEVIAYSGNTGGSGGPHLHFEVRDKMERVLNPLAFGGFQEIADDVPPTFAAMAVRPLGLGARVEGEFKRREYRVKRFDATHFAVTDTIRASGWIGLELAMFDRFTKADNHNGVQQVAATVNGQSLLRYIIDGVPFSQQRMVSCHINYSTFKATGSNFQKCYVDDGNALSFYQPGPAGDRGRLRVQPGRTYNVVIRAADSYGNTTELRVTLRGESVSFFAKGGKLPAKRATGLTSYVDENVLVVRAPTDSDQTPAPLQLFVPAPAPKTGSIRYDLRASYVVQGTATYLYDLRGGLPDSVLATGRGGRLRFNFQGVLPSTGDHSFSTPNLTLVTDPGTLFDTLYVQPNYADEVWSVNSPMTPLFRPLKVTLRPATIPADLAHTAAYSLVGKRASFEGGIWSADKTEIAIATKNLGRYALLADTIAPKAKLVKKTPNELRFTISDNLSGIAGWRCEVDGKWLLLHYEYKTATLYSEKLDPAQRLNGPIKLTVKDAMGNEAVVEGQL
jgi:Peptidase family M23